MNASYAALTTTTQVAAEPAALRPGSKLTGADVGVPVRRLGQTYATDIPLFWFRDNALVSMFFAGFSAKLPSGEAQFIHSVRLFQEQVTDPVLRAQVKAFIGQEAHHSKEHEALNNMLKARGVDLGRIERYMAETNAWMRNDLTPREQLAMTVCAEHLTALMADYFISYHPEYLDEIHPQMARIWAWHAIEETEHKAVAFDVYDQLVGDRKLLHKTMRKLTTIFLTMNSVHAAQLVRAHGAGRDWRMWREGVAFLRGMIKELKNDYMDFYRADFHPWQHDNRAALQVARAKYLGEQ